MAHPKRRQSKQRQRKRRTHYKAASQSLTQCPTTGEFHLTHRAYWHEEKLYWKGQVVIDKTATAEDVA